jgi:mutator protein MutT
MTNDRPTHAVKAVIRNSEGYILFLQRTPDSAKKVTPNWDFAGGIVEPGEEDREALRREIKEELGVDSTIGNELGQWTFFRPFDQKTVTVTNYHVDVLSNDFVLSDEHIDSKWVTFDEARRLSVKDPSLFNALGE